MSNVSLRCATTQDAKQIKKIYSYYVENTPSTFEITPPTLEEIEKRIESVITEGYPYIVAVYESRVIGFSYAKMYYGRKGFKPTVENSVYVDNKILSLKLKVGSLLLEELINQCKNKNIKNIIAYIGGGEKNKASIGLHKKYGFKLIGIYEKIGYKLDKYHDMAGLQLKL